LQLIAQLTKRSNEFEKVFFQLLQLPFTVKAPSTSMQINLANDIITMGVARVNLFMKLYSAIHQILISNEILSCLHAPINANECEYINFMQTRRAKLWILRQAPTRAANICPNLTSKFNFKSECGTTQQGPDIETGFMALRHLNSHSSGSPAHMFFRFENWIRSLVILIVTTPTLSNTTHTHERTQCLRKIILLFFSLFATRARRIIIMYELI
jgi:hypothetical protein